MNDDGAPFPDKVFKNSIRWTYREMRRQRAAKLTRVLEPERFRDS